MSRGESPVLRGEGPTSHQPDVCVRLLRAPPFTPCMGTCSVFTSSHYRGSPQSWLQEMQSHDGSPNFPVFHRRPSQHRLDLSSSAVNWSALFFTFSQHGTSCSSRQYSSSQLGLTAWLHTIHPHHVTYSSLDHHTWDLPMLGTYLSQLYEVLVPQAQIL